MYEKSQLKFMNGTGALGYSQFLSCVFDARDFNIQLIRCPFYKVSIRVSRV
ncbi:hypothetical protein GCM10008090_04830 [Arenicella chitinivorans]|uniref:Uncharacterized protein n=1 Tax=Arenicella chitinivorans TaxID=1329800 RepID=A0A918RHP6_9GAMM|nr:hypothetical protein GCM10008090_04830 [Arenicella chitinivorans]